MSEKTTACPNCGGNQWITRERSDGTQITRCVMCNTERPKSETTNNPNLLRLACASGDGTTLTALVDEDGEYGITLTNRQNLMLYVVLEPADLADLREWIERTAP